MIPKADNEKMKIPKSLLFSILLLFSFLPVALAEEKSKDRGVKVNGVIFNIAKDRKIEKTGGIYEPEGLDKYVERRMNEVSENVKKVETRVEEINRKLDEISLSLNSNPVSAAKDSATK